MERARTLGELKESGYRSVPVKDELRANLICKLKRREKLFPGIVGYDETVVPQLINAILAAVREGASTPKEIVGRVYSDVSPKAHAMAERAVLAHLEKLEDDGLVEQISREIYRASLQKRER